jgi:hypothetical protein
VALSGRLAAKGYNLLFVSWKAQALATLYSTLAKWNSVPGRYPAAAHGFEEG